MRWAMPQPCMGSSAMVLRISGSNVPWTKSVGLLIHPPQLSTVQYMLPLLLSMVKGGDLSREDFQIPKEVPMFGRIMATPLIGLDAGKDLEMAVAVAELLATTDGGSSAAEFIELARVLAAGRIG